MNLHTADGLVPWMRTESTSEGPRTKNLNGVRRTGTDGVGGCMSTQLSRIERLIRSYITIQ